MGLLAVDRVRVRHGGLTALDDVSLEVERGEVVALLGPNGSGKSTLLDCVTGLRRPDAGRVLLDGRDVTAERPARRARRGLARTFQSPRLAERETVLENAMLGRHRHESAGVASAALGWPGGAARREERASRARAEACLERVGLLGERDRAVETLDAEARRLVALARALASEPRLLLADEPAAGLGPPGREGLATLLRGVRDDGVTLLLVEHRLDLALGLADRVVVLDAGRVVARGAPTEIGRTAGVLGLA